jgi:hypothetical protein
MVTAFGNEARLGDGRGNVFGNRTGKYSASTLPPCSAQAAQSVTVTETGFVTVTD